MNEISATIALDGDTRRCCNNPDCNNVWPCKLHPDGREIKMDDAADVLIARLAEKEREIAQEHQIAFHLESALTDLGERLRQREAELDERDGRIGRTYEVAHEHARTKPHETVPVQVWADIDAGIAYLVRYLNTIEGVRTDASCQGTEGYRPYVLATWNAETDARLRAEFEIEALGEFWGYVRRKEHELA